jgi:PTS system nitrogen regulatory IIA component
MKLASLIEQRRVLCGAQASDYSEAKKALLRLLEENEGIKPEPLLAALAEREQLASTIVAPGVAFPHARVGDLTDFHLLVATFPQGFSAPGADEPVRFVVMFLMPEGASNLYLKSMSAMAQVLAQPGALEKIVAAKDENELIEFFAATGVTVKDVVTAQDVMDKNPPFVNPWSTLREVADLMVKSHSSCLPVVNDKNEYLGMVDAADLLKVGLPDYLLSMGSVAFLSNFEPFGDLLKQEQSLTVESLIREDGIIFMTHTPMIVVASKLVREGCRSAPVLEEKKLAGIISTLDFVHKVVRA